MTIQLRYHPPFDEADDAELAVLEAPELAIELNAASELLSGF